MAEYRVILSEVQYGRVLEVWADSVEDAREQVLRDVENDPNFFERMKWTGECRVDIVEVEPL